MTKQIWNEGRVVGLSAWEIYVRQHMSIHGDTVPVASEQEWLASSLTMGSSLLLRIPNSNNIDSITESTHYAIDIPLPSNTRIGAANTILASFFDGDATFADINDASWSMSEPCPHAGWAQKVTDYGELISNTSDASPADTVDSKNTISQVPIQTDNFEDWSLDKKNKLRDYMKIVDGIVIQPGTWKDNKSEGEEPHRDEIQDLSDRPVVRLHIKGKISSSPIILLTGFSIRSVLAGVTAIGDIEEGEGRNNNPSIDPSVNGWQHGEFLGPAIYPWVNKIVFSVPSSYIAYFESSKYERKLPDVNTAKQKIIADKAVIDMNSNGNVSLPSANDPHDFYDITSGWTQETNGTLPTYTGASIKYDVAHFTTLGDGTAVLVTYQKKSIYPPALYGSYVSSDGENYIDPIDCVAPGSMKMFITDDAAVLKEYEETYPGTQGIAKNARTGELYTYNSSSETLRPIATLKYEEIPDSHGHGRATVIQAGDNIGKSLSVMDRETGKVFRSAGTADILNATRGTIHWDQLLQAFHENKSIDLISSALGGSEHIRLTRGPDGRWIITNTAPATVDTLANILKAGYGISIVKQGNSLVITNTKPYDQPGNEKWVTLEPGTHFTTTYYGSFGTAYGGPLSKVHTVHSESTGPHYASKYSHAEIAKKHLTIKLSFSSLYNKNNDPYSIAVRVSTSKDGWRLGCADFDKFQLKHTDPVQTTKGSWIFSVVFKGTVTPVRGYTFNLSRLNDAKLFNWYDESQPSIWNIRDKNRDNNKGTSNDVYANLEHKISGAGTLLAYGVSISDGFNGQIQKIGNSANLYTNPPYYSGHLNTKLRGTFFGK